MRTSTHRILGILALASTVAVGAAAQPGQRGNHDPGQAVEITVVGEVIDPVCYLTHGSRGMEHKGCADACVKQGVTLAILEDKTGQVFMSLPADHSNPNAKLTAFVAERVKVTGTLYSKGGLKGLHVKTVARVR